MAKKKEKKEDSWLKAFEDGRFQKSLRDGQGDAKTDLTKQLLDAQCIEHEELKLPRRRKKNMLGLPENLRKHEELHEQFVKRPARGTFFNVVQSQASLTDQLEALCVLANENGLYDAADWLSTQLAKIAAK